MGALEPWHWIVLIAIVLIVIGGGSWLPKIGRAAGRNVSGLKDGLKEGTEQFKAGMNESSAKEEKEEEKPKTIEKGEG